MKFVLSYSGGKDSVLALHKMVSDGHEPVALLVAFRQEAGRSWMHGIDPPLLNALAESLGLPMLICPAAGETYGEDMERSLGEAKAMGAEACVFGDIDVEDHRQWDEARCAAAGLEAVLPLWGRDREENAREAISLGFRCLIKCIQTDVLPESCLGQPLSLAMLDEMRRLGVDLCGENGEYHTVATDGPVFRYPVETENRGIVRLGHITAADLVLREPASD